MLKPCSAVINLVVTLSLHKHNNTIVPNKKNMQMEESVYGRNLLIWFGNNICLDKETSTLFFLLMYSVMLLVDPNIIE